MKKKYWMGLKANETLQKKRLVNLWYTWVNILNITNSNSGLWDSIQGLSIPMFGVWKEGDSEKEKENIYIWRNKVYF